MKITGGIFLFMLILMTGCGDTTNDQPEIMPDWTVYTSRDGLVANEVYDIFVDSENTKWFATEYGVSSFRNGQWNSYTTTDGLLFHKVTGIAEAQNGVMWFATPLGASRFDGNYWTNYTTQDGMADDQVLDVAVDRYNQKWFATPSGAVMYDDVTWYLFVKQSDTMLVNNHITVVEADDEGIWFGTEYGISKKTPYSWYSHIFEDGNPWNFITDIDYDSGSDVVWISTLAGAASYDGQSYQSYTMADGLVHYQVYGVARDLNENIWFATQKGISRFDGAEWKSYTTADGLAGDWVTDIEVDLNGDVWFAHMPGGVSKLNVTLPN